jgi:hypothetical protein
MNILIFKTNIRQLDEVTSITPQLEALENIVRWSVDTDDCDGILRVEGTEINPNHIIEITRQAGFECSELLD